MKDLINLNHLHCKVFLVLLFLSAILPINGHAAIISGPKLFSSVLCGNIICDPGETSTTCPSDCTPVGPVCGNTSIESPEECDDGNHTDWDGCSSLCKVQNIVCGDGLIAPGETCDDGTESPSCNSDCTTSTCGDNKLNTSATEECDDGNHTDWDGCSSLCKVQNIVCGDGLIAPGETCDDGIESPSCNSDCTASTCGDNKLNPFSGEECDDGNHTDWDGCSSLCKVQNIVCGDGLIAPGETCDDGIESPSCNSDCTTSTCGDNKLNTSAAEECDDGNHTDWDGCSSLCKVQNIVCGDGLIAPGETCDDGTESPSCNSDCTASTCGDNKLNPFSGEECDDGNHTDWDGCSSLCKVQNIVCGDGLIAPGETCDDGIESPSCNSDCTISICGDNKLNTFAGEQCDDSNTSNNDGCSSNCHIESTPDPVCGNEIVETGEDCDDGNAIAGDGCSSACTVEINSPVCGNNSKEPPEECDDGNLIAEDGCSSTCKLECGNNPLQSALCYKTPTSSCSLPEDIIVKLDDGTEQSIFDRGATIEEVVSTSCPYLNPPPAEPPNISRHVDVFDLSENCAPCSSSVKDLIYAYYDGDLSAGSTLCTIPPEDLNNCVVLEAKDQLINYQVPTDPWEEIVTAFLSPITDAINRNTYDMQASTELTVQEESKLLKRWPRSSTKYYAATRQHWFAYGGIAPQDITVMFPPAPPQFGGNGNPVRVHYRNRDDLLAAMISPVQALMDFQDSVSMSTNFWPDFRNEDNPLMILGGNGRRNSGSLNYEFRVARIQNALPNPANPVYMPYYHADFIDPYPLFLFARLIDSNGNLDNAFSNTWINWNVDRNQAMRIPLPQPPGSPEPRIYPPHQVPTSSWWAGATTAPAANRFAVIINGAVSGENGQPSLFSFIADIANLIGIQIGPDSAAERFIKGATIAYIENILRNNLNYPAANIATYDVSMDSLPNITAFQTKIDPIINTARGLRTNNPNARIELIFYFHGHGRSVRLESLMAGEQPIDMAWFKEGGLEHEFWLGGNNSLLESTLKDFANGFVKSNDNPDANNRIFDRIDFIDGSCESGAGIY